MKVEDIAIGKVKPYPNNPRIFDRETVFKVAKSIQSFGFRQPIVTDKKLVVIAGHVRLEAAHLLKLKTVPVHLADMTPANARAYRLVDNKTAEQSVWNDAVLAKELQACLRADEALVNFAWPKEEMDAVMAAAAEFDGHGGEAGVRDKSDDNVAVTFWVPADRADDIRTALQETLDGLLGE